MVKAHSPINWQNEPSRNTPINETNLNKMDSTIGVLDNRIIEQDTSKLDKSTAYTMVKDISFNENNGVFTVTRLNGSTFTIDTKLEKISINFDYNKETQQIEIILIDGTKQYIDISSLISPIDFVDSDTIGWEVTSDWKVKAKVLDGSITEDMLQPNYLAEIKVETEKSAQSMANAKISENNAKQSELNAKASEEQALAYSNNAQPLAQSVRGKNPTVSNSTDGNVIYFNNKGYTQQESTPSPDAPIHINGLADKGYFDGVLQQGYYNYGVGDTASFVSSSSVVCNKNYIACKSGDTITLEYETNATLRTIFVDKNMRSLSTSSLNGTKITVTAPENTKYFLFVVGESNITPSTAKHISVTINGMYAVKVKTDNKNLFKHTLATTTSNGVTCTNNGDGTYSLNGKASADTTFYLYNNTEIPSTQFLGNVKILGCPNGGSATTYGLGVSNASWIGANDLGDGATIDTNTIAPNRVYIFVKNGVTCNNLLFKPMLTTDLEATYDDFVEHQSSEALIPTSSPFYEGDFIEVYADGSGREYRENGTADMGDLAWTYDSSLSRFSAKLDGISANYNVRTMPLACEKYVAITDGRAYEQVPDKSIYHYETYIAVHDKTYTDAETFKNDMQGTLLVYKLATPTSTPLTAEQVAEFMKLQTFKPVTHVNADGEVTVRYYCNSDSGESVEMLHGMVDDLKEQHSISSNVCDIQYYNDQGLLQAIISKKNISHNALNNIGKLQYTYCVNYDSMSASTGNVYMLVADGFFPKEVFNMNVTVSNKYGECATLYEEYQPDDTTIRSCFSVYYVLSGVHKGKVVCAMAPQTYSVRRVTESREDMTNPLRDYALDGAIVGLYNGKPLKQIVMDVLDISGNQDIDYNPKYGITGERQYGEMDVVFIDMAHSYVKHSDGTNYPICTEDWTFSVSGEKIKLRTNANMTDCTALLTLLYTNV